MTDKFREMISVGRSPTEKAKLEVLRDDPAEAPDYRAARRVRTFAFPDVWFTDHIGTGQAFQWAHVRRMLKDGKGTRLTLIWPDGEVHLSGRNLDKLEEDIQRRIIAEFHQVTPGHADSVPPGEPVITTMRIGMAGDSGNTARPPGISLVGPDD